MNIWLRAGIACSLLMAAGCLIRHKVEVQPIYVKMDINLKVDKDLENFFAGVEAGQTNQPPAASEGGADKPAETPGNTGEGAPQ